MITNNLGLIEYANIAITKASLPFEKKEKKYYDAIHHYEKVFKSKESDSAEYWAEYEKFQKMIKGFSKKGLFELASMWSSVRQGYDVIEIIKSSIN
jgi:hypothetical protein